MLVTCWRQAGEARWVESLGNTVLQGVVGVLGVRWKVSVALAGDGWTQVTLVGLGVFFVPWSPAATISE